MKEEWLMPGAIVPVDPDTTKALVDEIKRLIGVIGGVALQAAAPVQEQCPNYDDPMRAEMWKIGFNAAQPAPVQEPVAWHTVHKAVATTIEKCKAASGMHRAIDLVVNAAQITHDTLGTDTTPPTYDQGWKDGYKHGAWSNTAATVQEPVAWVDVHDYTNLYYRKPAQVDVVPLYYGPTTPPAAPVQEPKLSEIFCGVDFADGVLSVSVLRRRPDDVAELLHSEQIQLQPPAAQRPVPEERKWVGLTDEQIDLFINGRGDEDDDDYVESTGDGFVLTDADLVKLVRRAEAKLRSENT